MPTAPIRNFNPAMQYRPFGRGGPALSTVTLGGMRYVHGWDQPRDQVPADMREQCARLTRLALDAGINHIETAHGYGKSEHCYGLVLNDDLKVPRDSYWLMTKGAAHTADDMCRLVDEQLKALKTDRIDLYGWHGINTAELYRTATAKGGPVEALLKLKKQGVIGRVGFSTHGPLDVIIDSLATGLFDFVNLHYYYFFQRNRGAVEYAGAKGLGVFIISPNDKGGQLFNAPPLLHQLCAPLTPIQFNARWCLKHPEITTLSFGLTEPAHVDEMRGIFPASLPLSAQDLAIQLRLDARISQDPLAAWDGYECASDPSGINIPEVLRFRRMWKCWDMEAFGKYRYNMLEAKGHWFPGHYASPELVAQVEAHMAPPGVPLQAMLGEAHQAFHKPKK
ncbi:MAG TPA: aldo/keto reductase [Planctomycetes bacterium]|nr:aldo/keto reductase [Planctomycetota bacterium]